VNAIMDYLNTQLGICSACSAVVALLDDREHQRWHKDRDEPAGILNALATAERELPI
jgi:hypothetical protein